MDEVIEGRIKFSVHEHCLEAAGDGHKRRTDRATYAGGRSWWGCLVSEIELRWQLILLLAFRHYRA